jgi:type IV pilus assembly protein PilB
MSHLHEVAKPERAADACRVRNPALLAALAAVDATSFGERMPQEEELSRDSLLRVLEDLGSRVEGKVLVIDPPSGLLPAVLGRLATEVLVVCSTAARAGLIAEQVSSGQLANVMLSSFLDTARDGARFDAILALRLASREQKADLPALLRENGAAVVPADGLTWNRRAERLLLTDAHDLATEDLDLATFRPLLGDILVNGGFVMRQEIDAALQRSRKTGVPIGMELLRSGVVREEDLHRALARQWHLPYVDTSQVLPRLDAQLVRGVPRKYLDHYQFLPVCNSREGLVVVTTNLDLPTWEIASVFDAVLVSVEFTSPTDLKRIWTAIDLGFVGPAQVGTPSDAATDPTEVEAPEDPRTVGLLDAIVLDAVAERASDIHLEARSNGARLRFRIDGSLHEIKRYQLSPDEVLALVNVTKLAANLDIAERRAPQGGRMHRRCGRHSLDLRVQTQPTLHGENLVLRILPQDKRPPTIEELGFPEASAERYRRLLREPHGLLLVVGATGTGKSTTLYAGLQLLAQDTTRKVITIEDPIEFALDGIQQTQVNPAVRFQFADAMRVFVREDPDVILVGEIRDPETALETIRASQTGHLVLATMHCNDTVDAVQRLADLGMQRNSIASELTAVIAQRLARRICTGCRTAARPEPTALAELFPDGAPDGFRCFVGRGCERCGGSGTRGRIALVEFLEVGPELRRAIARGVLVDDLRQLARTSGTVTLRDNALRLVAEGVISIEELYDVLSSEQMRGR